MQKNKYFYLLEKQNQIKYSRHSFIHSDEIRTIRPTGATKTHQDSGPSDPAGLSRPSRTWVLGLCFGSVWPVWKQTALKVLDPDPGSVFVLMFLVVWILGLVTVNYCLEPEPGWGSRTVSPDVWVCFGLKT